MQRAQMITGFGVGDVRLRVIDYIETSDGLTFLAYFAILFGRWQS